MSLVKKYFTFSKTEQKDVFLTGIAIGFIIFFFAWNQTNYTLITGIRDILLFTLCSIGSMWFFVASAKYIAIKKQYTADYKGWIPGSLIGFAIAFTTFGFVPLMFPGLVEYKVIQRLKHGGLFTGETKEDLKLLLLVPSLASAVAAIFFQVILLGTEIQLFYFIMMLNIFISFFSLLPIPQAMGLHIFYVDKKTYFLLFFFVFSLMILLLFNVVISVLVAILLAIILFMIFKKLTKNSPLALGK